MQGGKIARASGHFLLKHRQAQRQLRLGTFLSIPIIHPEPSSNILALSAAGTVAMMHIGIPGAIAGLILGAPSASASLPIASFIDMIPPPRHPWLC